MAKPKAVNYLKWEEEFKVLFNYKFKPGQERRSDIMKPGVVLPYKAVHDGGNGGKISEETPENVGGKMPADSHLSLMLGLPAQLSSLTLYTFSVHFLVF